jgi:hypothetical protein
VGQYESDEEFRFALVADGAAAPAPGIASDDRRKRRMLRYLSGATVILRDTTSIGIDQLDPDRPVAVPRGYRTDGEWIWPEALHYYLDRHDIVPTPEFAATMAERAYWSPLVSAGRIGQARLALAAHGPGPFEPPGPDQSRFPDDAYDVLVTYGWTPGRDIGTEIDVWWKGAEPSLPPMPDDLAAAGRAILAEFGGLTYPVYGYGPDRPIVGFQMLPSGTPPDPVRLTAAAIRLGGPFFPLGSVYDWRSEIVLHPEHGIVTVGDVDRHLGRDIDGALIALIRGAAPDRRTKP